MPNKNYLRGRRLEYAVKKDWEERGWIVVRTAGSHGFCDLVAFRKDAPVVAIQCKRTFKQHQAIAMIKRWKLNPPFAPGSVQFQQCLVVQVERGLRLEGTV